MNALTHRFRGIWKPLALVLAVVVVYLPGLDGGFVFDDIPNLVDNTELHVTSTAWSDWMTAMFSSPASKLQRPLAMLSFAVNHYFTGLDPRPMKITNIAIHAMNALLVLWLVRLLFRSPRLADLGSDTSRKGIAWFIAAAWALHPINLMAVLFVIQRMESLSHSFVFLGLILYLLGRYKQMQGRNGWPEIAFGLIGCTAVGLLVKESAVLLPLYAFILEFSLLRFDSASPRATSLLKWLFGVCLWLPAIAGTAWLVPHVLPPETFSSRNFTLIERLLTEGRVVIQYLSWTIFPNLNQLGLYHDDYQVSRGLFDPVSTATALVLVVALLVSSVYLRRSRPMAALGLQWFFAAQLLTATVIPLELMFEHRNYFASLGSCLVLGDLLLAWPSSGPARRAGALVAGLLVVMFAFGTMLRSSEWDHPVRFVQSEAAKHPTSPRATYELARMLVILSDYKADSRYAKPAMDAIEVAIRAPGSSVLPEQAALIFAARIGQPLREEWWKRLEWKLHKQPIGQQTFGALGALVHCANVKLCDFPPERMLALFAATMTHGDHAELFNLYGSYALTSLHDPKLALALWRESVRLQPSEPQYHINLCRLLILLHARDEARQQIAELRRIGRLGQYESMARKLEESLASAQPVRR